MPPAAARREQSACSMRLALVALVAMGGLQLLLSSRTVGCPPADATAAGGSDGAGAPAAARRSPRLRRDPAARRAAGGPLAPAALGNLRLNPAARSLFGTMHPATTSVVHFTFGSGAMLDFLRNWLHYVNRAGLAPAVAGAADAQMLRACTAEGIAALGIADGLDVRLFIGATPVVGLFIGATPVVGLFIGATPPMPPPAYS